MNAYGEPENVNERKWVGNLAKRRRCAACELTEATPSCSITHCSISNWSAVKNGEYDRCFVILDAFMMNHICKVG